MVNVLRIAAAMAGDKACITEDHLPDDFLDEVRHAGAAGSDTLEATAAAFAAQPSPQQQPLLARTMKDAERETIREALAAANGNISLASKRLGICRNTIYRKVFWDKSR
jgi:transcriptional regulator of acetoin/glycerol metabolism